MGEAECVENKPTSEKPSTISARVAAMNSGRQTNGDGDQWLGVPGKARLDAVYSTTTNRNWLISIATAATGADSVAAALVATEDRDQTNGRLSSDRVYLAFRVSQKQHVTTRRNVTQADTTTQIKHRSY